MSEEYTVESVYAAPRSTEYRFYLDNEIGGPSQFRELFHALEAATEDDVVKIVINSPGGFLHSTIMICNSIRDCSATVVGVLNGMSCSGASLILLACDVVEIKPHSTFMAHTSAGVDAGKLSDTARAIVHSKKELSAFYHDIYEGFFTTEEIEGILDGKDEWLHGDEINERMEARAAHYEEIMRQQIEEMKSDVPTRDELKKLNKDKLIGLILGEDE